MSTTLHTSSSHLCLGFFDGGEFPAKDKGPLSILLFIMVVMNLLEEMKAFSYKEVLMVAVVYDNLEKIDQSGMFLEIGAGICLLTSPPQCKKFLLAWTDSSRVIF